MIKKHFKTMILTTIIILLPALAYLLLWDKLPDQLPFHWGINGEVDRWITKGPELFYTFALLLAIHWGCAAFTGADPKHSNHSDFMLQLMLWICPAISVLVHAIMLATAFGTTISVEVILPLVLGGLFLVIGNYMPKCKQNYTIGIKIPWTLADEGNWNATHRFAGWVWTIGSLLIMGTAFFGNFWLFFIITLIMVLFPIFYSYLYYRKHKKETA